MEKKIDVTKFKCLKTLEGDLDYVYSVAYSPDGTKIISGSDDTTIKIWGEE
jgi:WD40 repeat protein